MPVINLDREIPRWSLPLLPPARYKGARGGRSSGKSHFFAEQAVEEMVKDPNLRILAIRETQRSLKFSAKHLIEKKIAKLGVGDHFDITNTEIRRVGGSGICVFTGMQDHTADSIKSFEDFRIAWFEEAHRMSKRSLEVLIPTIRAPGSQLWFSWNPEQPDDPIEAFFKEMAEAGDTDYALVTVNFPDNPFCPVESIREAKRLQRVDPDMYAHVWLGEYNRRSQAQVLAGKWRVAEFEPEEGWDGPYYGADWGFAQDPTTLVRFWLAPGRETHRLFIEDQAYSRGVDLVDTPALFEQVPGAREHTIRADPARPETISHMRRAGFQIHPAPSWKGSVHDGVAWLRSAEEIVIHERCTHAIDEARHWCYKVDRITGDPLPKLVDEHDHTWDAIRYGAAPMIQRREVIFAWA